MKNTALALVALLLLLMPGCTTTPEGESVPDWNKISVAGDEVLVMLDQQIVSWQHRPETVAKLQRIRDVVAKLDMAADAIAAGGGSLSEFENQLAAAVAIVDAWLAEVDASEDPDLHATLSAARGALGVIRILTA